MSKELKKLYILFIIALFVFVIVFPYIFININNGINYMRVKGTMMWQESKEASVNIYDDKANIIIMFDDGWKTQYTVRI